MDSRREPGPSRGLPLALGLPDLVLFFVTTGTNLQWVAVAAAAGPSSLVVWLVGCGAMFVPLGYAVISLSSRYPEEGGMYVWSKRAFGDFAGFITGWTYWTSNLPYFPGVLYFAAANLLFLGGERWLSLSASPLYFAAFSLLGLGLATALNLMGLGVEKWLTNAGAVARCLATLLLVGLGAAAWMTVGSATDLSLDALRPSLALKDLVFWSTIAFALTGFESASFMGEEIRDARRSIPRAILLSAPLITTLYVLGTLSVLVASPPQDVTGLQAVLQAVRSAASRLGAPALVPLAAALVTLSALGSVGAWLAAVARIPFVAGLDRFLPAGFARLHPRWGSPHVALLTQSGITLAFVLLGQAGTSVRGAYEALVSTTILVTMIPFLFLFAAAVKTAWEPGGKAAPRLPGGPAAVAALSLVGFVTTLGAIVLAAIPAEAEPRKALAVAKVLGMTALMVGSGVAVYATRRRRSLRGPVA